METQHRVWIEIEHPSYSHGKVVKGRTPEERDAIGEERAALVSRLLGRMGVMPTYQGKRVFWWPDKGRYCWTLDEAGTFTECSDHGHWYSLDHLGREEA